MKIHNLVQFREKFCACEENDLFEYIPYKMFTSTKYSNCKSTIDQSQLHTMIYSQLEMRIWKMPEVGVEV